MKMTLSPEIRDLAQRLLTHEAAADTHPRPQESATLRVYEKLRQSLTAIAGVTSFQSLACRALVLAKSEDIGLGVVQITADGSLQDFSEYEPRVDIDNGQTSAYQANERGVILIARLLGLLHMFLGEVLTLRLLRDAWPNATFDDRNSGNGRKA
jgi:hypothetical protein